MLNCLEMSNPLTNIDALSALANLEIPSSRKAKLAEDIGEILSYVERLQALDVGRQHDPRDVRSVSEMRNDVVEPLAQEERDGVVRNFPRVSEDGLLEAHAAIDRDV